MSNSHKSLNSTSKISNSNFEIVEKNNISIISPFGI